MQTIAPEYANEKLTVAPGSRLHRLVALMFDMYIDDLTDERIAELERQVESWRWCNAAGRMISRLSGPADVITTPTDQLTSGL